MPFEVKSPFLFGFGQGMLGAAGQYGVNPFAAAMQQGVQFDELSRQRRAEDEKRKAEEQRERRRREIEDFRLKMEQTKFEALMDEQDRRAGQREQGSGVISDLLAAAGQSSANFVGPHQPGEDAQLRALAVRAGADPDFGGAGLSQGLLNLLVPKPEDDAYENRLRDLGGRLGVYDREGNLIRSDSKSASPLSAGDQSMIARREALTGQGAEKIAMAQQAAEVKLALEAFKSNFKAYNEQPGHEYAKGDKQLALAESAKNLSAALGGGSALSEALGGDGLEIGDPAVMAEFIATKDPTLGSPAEILKLAQQAVDTNRASSIEEALLKLIKNRGISFE